jgi:tetratricopeptide (TPR) repeat protein
MRRSLLVVALLLLTAPPSPAQDADFRDELRFAEALRARGDSDLALELLLRLEKTATAEQKKELSLELAKTRLRDAASMPEAARRLARYREARADFQKFIAESPGHPRVPEAYLDIARTLDLQGKTDRGRRQKARRGPGPLPRRGRAEADPARPGAELLRPVAHLPDR